MRVPVCKRGDSRFSDQRSSRCTIVRISLRLPSRQGGHKWLEFVTYGKGHVGGKEVVASSIREHLDQRREKG